MITLCMIVKNEEETLEKCLSSINNLVNEIIIVDTGSIDKTKEIAVKYTDKVFDFKWCDDFSRARNFSLSKASNSWILVLDADEVIKDFHKESIEKFCNDVNNNIVGRLKRINEYEDQYGIKKYIERVNRFFNKNCFEYEGIIHEQMVYKNGQNYKTKNIELVVDHIGYSKEVLNRTNKIERNIELLQKASKEKPKDSYIQYQLGKSYFMNKDYNTSCKYFNEAVTLLDNFSYEYAQDLVESLGYTLINLNLFKEALEIHKYEKYYSKSPDFLFLLGLIEMNNSNFENAANTFLKCTEFEEGKIEGITSFLPLYNIGVIFECLGLNEEALNYYKLCEGYGLALNRINNLCKM